MKYTTAPLLTLFLLVFLFSNCRREIVPADQVDIGQEYFPLEKGHFIEYDVDSLKFNDFAKRVDTVRYELRDVVGDTFSDNENRISYLITRYRRNSIQEPWTEILTYYATKTSFRVEVVEDNLRFIKLVFPVKENVRWYGNTYIPTKLNSELAWLEQWYYKYNQISLPYTNGILIFEDALVVDENDYVKGNPDMDPDNYASKIYAQEVYAKNVGLIYREIENWVYQSTTTKYRNGFKIIFRAKNYN